MDIVKLIEENGGTTAFARLLKSPKKTSPQTVNNWKTRGVPSLVVLNNPKIFKDWLKKRKTA